MARTVESKREGSGSGSSKETVNKQNMSNEVEGSDDDKKCKEKGPKAPTLHPGKFTIHILKLGRGVDDGDLEAATVQNLILQDFPLLLPHMKSGDAVENLDGDGYRSSGAYFVEAVDSDGNTVQVIERGYDIDEYGNQPSHYTTFDMFPPDYFNPSKAQINNMYLPEETESNLYWHNHDGWSILSAEMASRIVVDANNPNNGSLQYDGQTYRFLGLQDGQTDNGLLVASDYNAETRTFGAGFC